MLHLFVLAWLLGPGPPPPSRQRPQQAPSEPSPLAFTCGVCHAGMHGGVHACRQAMRWSCPTSGMTSSTRNRTFERPPHCSKDIATLDLVRPERRWGWKWGFELWVRLGV